MPNREMPPVQVTVKIDGIDNLVQTMSTSLSTIEGVQKELKRHGRIMQARAVSNVSGRTVTFQGKAFIINRQTGKLARSIQVTEPNPLATGIVASAAYAGDVELGTRGPVDLKRTKLAGKIVALPVSKLAGKALTKPSVKPTATVTGFTASGFKVNPQVATTGKMMGNKYIVFRRVPGPGGKGWIIPMRPGRPFMAEALAYTTPLLKEAIEKAFAQFLEDGD